MRKKYPHKQTIIIAVICIIAVFGVFLYTSSKIVPNTSNNIDVETTNSLEPISTTTNIDWRSQFITSNQENISSTSKSANKNSPNSTNLTEVLSANFVSSFSQLNKAGLINNTDVLNQTADNIISNSLGTINPKEYLVNDLKIVPDSLVNMTNYANSLSNIIGSYSPSTKYTEFAIINEYTKNNDASILKEVAPILKEQRRILTSLINIPTPSSLAQYQLNLINGLSLMVTASESFQVLNTDSVKGLAGISLHITAVQNISDALNNINIYIENGGSKFDFPWEILNSLLN